MTRQLCYRGAVNTWECDEMGHMNVKFYLGKAHQGLVNVGALLGLGPQALDAMGAELVLEAQHIRFLREMRVGADLSIEAGVVEISGGVLTIFQEALPLAASHVSATLVTKIALRDIKSGAVISFSDDVLARAGELATDIPDYGTSRTLSFNDPMFGVSEAEAIRTGHLPVSIAAVRSDQVDKGGCLYPDQYIGHISDGIGMLFGLMTKGLEDEIYERSETIGGAALEYRFDFLKQPRLGDTIKVLSAPKQIMDKVYVLNHVIVDGETGEPFARANSVHIAFDLVTRKSVPVPDLLRRGLEAHLIRTT